MKITEIFWALLPGLIIALIIAFVIALDVQKQAIAQDSRQADREDQKLTLMKTQK